MTRKRLLFAALVWLVLVGIAGFEAHLIARQREELSALRQAATLGNGIVATLRLERDSVAAELAQAESQLAALLPSATSDPSLTPQRQSEMKAWLARMKQLQQHFIDRPEQGIPEMQLLADDDWLRIAKNCSLDSDDARRKALAEVRGAAVARFAAQLRAALRGYTRSGKTEQPASILAFAPYFETPVDLAMLRRYEVVPTPRPRSGSLLTSASARGEWLVRNKAAVDPDFDWRNEVGPDGGTSSSFGPWAWMPDLRERHQRASADYAEANNGVFPSKIADAIPYFNPPLDPSFAQKLIKAYDSDGR